jgi:hypothetical protein
LNLDILSYSACIDKDLPVTSLVFMQAGALSPTKLRMKLLGAHNRVRVISNSSARTSPSKSVEPSQAQNRLLVCDVLEEGTYILPYLCLTCFSPDEK